MIAICYTDCNSSLRELTHGFLDLIRHHGSEGLDTWLKDVRASTLWEFLSFAQSHERDKPAILAMSRQVVRRTEPPHELKNCDDNPGKRKLTYIKAHYIYLLIHQIISHQKHSRPTYA